MKSDLGGLSSLLLIVIAVSDSAAAGTFIQPPVSGTTPSGLQWSDVAAGTALPVRTSSTNPFNGAPGAVVYVNTTTGQILFDPKGLSISTFLLTYTTGTGTVSGTSPGPFNPDCPNAFPEGATGTITPSRVGVTIGPPLGGTLLIGGAPNRASTNGFLDLPWAFPLDLIQSGSLSSLVLSNFRTIGQGANANANILGYGSQQSVFQYTANGITGNQVGAVIGVPEPSTIGIAGVSLMAAWSEHWRRRRRRYCYVTR